MNERARGGAIPRAGGPSSPAGDPAARGTYASPRVLLDRYGLRAKKSWGQNFLGDEAILDGIAALAVTEPGGVVVELGSGLGHLTARLVARGARVVAVERDRDMARVLRGELGDHIQLLEADAVRLDYAALAASLSGSEASRAADGGAGAGSAAGTRAIPGTAAGAGEGAGARAAAGAGEGAGAGTAADAGTRARARTAAGGRHAPLAVVGNLPYHLTSPILFSILDQRESVARAVFLVQREVAERLAADPGTKDWGLLSVLLQQCADVSIVRRVPAGAFHPPPRVESAVVLIAFREPAHPAKDPARFRALVKAGFAQRRKVLENALGAAKVGTREQIAAALEAAGIDGRRRGETLTVEEWSRLERAF